MKTQYAVLKEHFDKLIGSNSFPYNIAIEPIRDTYEEMFGKKINLYDVYQTPISVSTSPINGIITLVGPETDELHDGIMPNGRDLVSVNIMPESILKGIYPDMSSWYINNVYTSMQNIVMMDRFFSKSAHAKLMNNPFVTFTKCVAFYFTFHHVAEFVSQYNDQVFKDILSKYVVFDDEDVDRVYESISSSKYTDEINEIYNIMTLGGTIKIS